MKDSSRPLVDRLSASSDLEEKLVTRLAPGTGTGVVLTRRPDGVSWSRKIGEVTPKLASTSTLLKTCG